MDKKLNIRTAVILCGGKGSRLGAIGKKIPKSLVKVKNKPIIWYIINFLKKNSFNHFILPVGHKGGMIKKYFNKNKKDFKNTNLEIINTGQNSSISQRIFKIKNYIKSDDFLLLNGDAIFMFNIKKIFNNHISRKDNITFLVCDTNLTYGIVGVENKKIVSFERDTNFFAVKKRQRKNFTGYIYSGISIIKKKNLKIKFQNFLNFEKEFYPLIIKKKNSNFVVIEGFWYSIDNQKDLSYIQSKINKNFEFKLNKLKKKILK